MRLYLAVLLSGLSLACCVWWLVSATDSRRAGPIADPPATRAEEPALLLEPPAPRATRSVAGVVQRVETQAPDVAAENGDLRARLEAEQARVAQLEAEQARLEFALGVRPILRQGETERMAALEQRLLQGHSPEAASDALGLARWKSAGLEVDALSEARGVELTEWQREQLIACALDGWRAETRDEAFARIAASRAE